MQHPKGKAGHQFEPTGCPEIVMTWPRSRFRLIYRRDWERGRERRRRPTYSSPLPSPPAHSNMRFNSSQASFNPFNYSAPYIMMTQTGNQVVGVACTDSKCQDCAKPTETLTLQKCLSGQWLGNITAYFAYSVMPKLLPSSSDGGLVSLYFSSSDALCSEQLMGGAIQENGVCTNVGGGWYYSYGCNTTFTIVTECVDAKCSVNCTTLAYPYDSVCDAGSGVYSRSFCYT